MCKRPVAYSTKATCENNKRKQRWILEVVYGHNNDAPCCFQNLAMLSADTGDCVTHGVKCMIPSGLEIHIASMSFSCKDLSKLKKGWEQFNKHVLQNASTSTGKAFL